jgi:phage repressor protein C with HTH and peptisase S24 domain
MANRIREFRKSKSVTLEDLAAQTGLSTSFLSRMEAGKRGLSLESTIRIAAALGVEPIELTDEFEESDIEQAKHMPLAERRAAADDEPGIPNFTIHAGMGPGGALSVTSNDQGEIYSDHSDGLWKFPEAVRAGWRNMQHVYSMPVTGDSMDPTLPSGSFVFVDTTHTVPSPEDIYALDYGDGLMIKRVKLVPRSDKVLIISDNERYGSDELMREDVRVYGRVVAWFQWRG